MIMAGLILHDISKSFDNKNVLDHISFEVEDGEFCILVGPSGCGKSTILRLIAGLERQDTGQIHVGAREVSRLSPRERDISMVFQSYALYPHMNVYENMAFSLRMQKLPKRMIEEKVRETARLLEIEGLIYRKPGELSGGQRQRVAIGRAIVRKPSVFLFDEPLSNLDARLRNTMRSELSALHRKLGATMVYVTHDQIEAMTLGQKIILLNKGRIQQIGTPKDVYNRPSNLFVAGFIGSPEINLINGRMEENEGALYFHSKDLTLNVGSKAFLNAYAGRDITLGIRPESLVPAQGPISAVIEFVEPLGAEMILHARFRDLELIARVSSDFGAREGDKISFSLKDGGLHFFCEGRNVLCTQ